MCKSGASVTRANNLSPVSYTPFTCPHMQTSSINLISYALPNLKFNLRIQMSCVLVFKYFPMQGLDIYVRNTS